MVLLIAIEDGELRKGSKIHCSLVCRDRWIDVPGIRMRLCGFVFSLLDPGFQAASASDARLLQRPGPRRHGRFVDSTGFGGAS